MLVARRTRASSALERRLRTRSIADYDGRIPRREAHHAGVPRGRARSAAASPRAGRSRTRSSSSRTTRRCPAARSSAPSRYPEAERDERLRTLPLRTSVMHVWFMGEADKRDDRYLATYASSKVALFAARAVLAHNRMLYRSTSGSCASSSRRPSSRPTDGARSTASSATPSAPPPSARRRRRRALRRRDAGTGRRPSASSSSPSGRGARAGRPRGALGTIPHGEDPARRDRQHRRVQGVRADAAARQGGARGRPARRRPGRSASCTRETFLALARRPLDEDPYPHLERADLLVVAPCSANTLAKLAHGIADNLVTEAALAHRAPSSSRPR